MKSILVLQEAYAYLHDEWQALTRDNGYNLIIGKVNTHDDLLEYCTNNDVEVIVNTWFSARRMGGYPKHIIDKLGIKAIIHQGAGYDVLGSISDWDSAGVEVANAPTHVAPSTANTAIFLTFAAMRKFNYHNVSLKAGNWLGSLPVEECHDPEGQVVSVVGMGSVGRKIKDRLLPFEFDRIQYSNRRPAAPEVAAGAEFVDLDTVWKTSDVIIFACPYNASTHHLFNKEAISKCKDGVVIVNIARGGVIDEQALVDGLKSGKIGSAGLDVFENEPHAHPDLIANDCVYLLPHVGAHSIETRYNIERELIEDVESVIKTGHVIHLVPEQRK